MLQKLKSYFHSFKERPDIWFFYTFLISSTLSIRKILYYYPINKSFNEYTSIYVYLSDIFLFLTIISCFFILCNKNKLLSIYNNTQKCSTPAQMFHVEHSTGQAWNIFSKNLIYNVPRGTLSLKKLAYQQITHNYILFFPIILTFFSFISILWSQSQEIAIFKSIKIFELAFLFFYTYKLFHVEQFIKNTWHIKNIFKIIMAIGLIQSIIGITQFYAQHSLGLTFLKESLISVQSTGVAKIIIGGQTFIRSYGLFPHPNIFGGFLIFSIIISVMYLKLFNRPTKKTRIYSVDYGQTLEIGKEVEQKNVPLPYKCSTWNIIKIKCGIFLNMLTTNRVRNIVLIIVLIQGIALLLTFSKSAIIGLLIGVFYLYYDKLVMYPKQLTTVNCNNRSSIFSLFKSISSYKKIFLIISIVFMLLLIIKPFKNAVVFKSLHERVFYLNVSRGTFLSDPLLGLGSGQFIINMQNIENIQSWQFQPVHNVFLLILNEFGIILFFMFIFFIYKILSIDKCSNPVQMFHPSTNVPRGTFYGAGVEHYTGQVWNTSKSNTQNENKPTHKNISNQSFYTYFKAIMIAFTFVMIFDHYFWDIQQGQILLWMLLGILAGYKKDYYIDI